jgi:D-arabinose 1-dehydrogenase-like Zn-dependent alcohol dehydrogenase
LRELIDLVRSGNVRPIPVATRPLDQADATLRDLANGKIVGRVVLTTE